MVIKRVPTKKATETNYNNLPTVIFLFLYVTQEGYMR